MKMKDTSTFMAVTEIAPVMNFNVYPNPANEIITIDYQLTATSMIKFRLYNVLGEPLLTEDHNEAPGIYRKHVDIHTYEKGIVLLEVWKNGDRMIKKILIE